MELPLAVWFSPMFPVGAFAYSHGLEWAQEAGDLRTVDDLKDWLHLIVERGTLHNDAIILSESYRAALRRDRPALAQINDLALALAGSRERHLETTTQGNAFLLAIEKSWSCETLALIGRAETDVAYPVAVALAASGHDIPLHPTLGMYGLGFVANLISAAIRLGVVGQSGGQSAIASLLPVVRDTMTSCESLDLDDLGTSAFRSDLASLRHETQYSRLFRS